MDQPNLPVKITSLVLVAIGAVLLAVNIATGGRYNIALPLVFLVLGGGFFIVGFHFEGEWRWSSSMYIPGFLLVTFGIIFLLNVLTNDWNAWAYAWLLLVAGVGVGMVVASQHPVWPEWVNWAGWGMAVLGITFFVVFGAVARGLFIQIMAPILLVAAGISLRFLHLDTLLPAAVRERLRLTPRPGPTAELAGEESFPSALVEPLSAREMEVLRLIDAGLSNQQIADRLSVAASTVKTHINNIYGKLGVQTRVQAVRRARELDLIKP